MLRSNLYPRQREVGLGGLNPGVLDADLIGTGRGLEKIQARFGGFDLPLQGGDANPPVVRFLLRNGQGLQLIKRDNPVPGALGLVQLGLLRAIERFRLRRVAGGGRR